LQNGALVVSIPDPENDYIALGGANIPFNGFLDRSFRVVLDVTITGTEYVRVFHGDADTVLTSGVHEVIIRKKNTSSPTNGIYISLTEAGTLILKSIAIYFDTKDNPFSASSIRIGNNSYNDAPSGVVIGKDALMDADNAGVVIGTGARLTDDGTFGIASSLDNGTVVGVEAKGYGSRTTVVGEKSHAAGQSSTTLGYGAFASNVHGISIGRGSVIMSAGSTRNALNTKALDLYLGNGWAHRIPTTPALTEGEQTADPSTIEVKIHGKDAFDARYPAYSSGTTYQTGDLVRYTDDGIYYSLQNSNSGNTPSSSSLFWRLVYTDPNSDGAQGDYNVSGGDIALYAGRATGTGESGSINFYVAEGNNGQNTKDTPLKAGEFRSEEAVTDGTHFYLLNVATGTMQRVKIGAAGTGPGGSGKALYID
jgi:hypothetical protein